jgi:hypothetical protein
MAVKAIIAVATRAGQKFIGPRKHTSFAQRNPWAGIMQSLCDLNHRFLYLK